MLTRAELLKIAEARLKDAAVLFNSKRYDGAIYLCGYAVEIALKARICSTLRWKGYPMASKEFNNLQSFKTHSLDVLLSLSGIEGKIKTKFIDAWSGVAAWDPEARYKLVGSAGKQETELMVESAKTLLRAL